MIILNNPNNPTGAILPAPLLRQIVELCEQKGDDVGDMLDMTQRRY